MKKLAYFFAAILALSSSFACNRQVEIDNPQPIKETLTFRAVLEQPDTKASLNSNYAVVWEPGDKIAVYNGTDWVESEALTDSDIKNYGRYATFSVSIAESKSNTYYAVYPASAAPSGAVSDDVLAVTLPDVQDIPSGGCVAKNALVQVCKTTDKNNMVFKNIASLIEFKAPESVDGYVSFEAFGAGDAALSIAGAASVNADSPVSVTGDATKVIVKGSFEAGKNYFAVIYPQSAVRKFRFVFSKEDETNGTMKAFRTGSTTGSALDFPLNGGNKFSNLGALSWLGPLSSKADLDKWAKYADYYLEGETVKLGADIDYEGDIWKPVNGNDATGFAGCLDGQGHSIYKIIIDSSTSENCGFFSSISSSEGRKDKLRVKDLLLGYNPSTEMGDEISNLTAETSGEALKVGILSGTITRSTIINVHNYIPLTAKQSEEVHLGGIAGRTGGKNCIIKNCSNHAVINYAGSHSSSYIGGIVATIGGNETEFTKCYNYGTVTRSIASSNKGNTFIGGIIARCGGSTQNTIVKDCHNNGTVGTKTDILANQVFIGGILGMDHSSGDETIKCISISNCSNATDGIVLCPSLSNSSAAEICIGGIVGAAKNQIIVSDCVNYGHITKSGNVAASQGKYGGIAGCVMSANCTITNCINAESGVIEDLKQTTAKKNQRIGGIAGFLNPGSIDLCKNLGIVKTENSGDGCYEYVGGIVGNYTAGIISNSCNSGTVSVSGSTERYASGGIVGLINGENVTTGDNCEVSGSISCNYEDNTGLAVGMYSKHSTTFGSLEKPVIIHSATVNGNSITNDNYLTYIAGTAAGISASGTPSANGDTIWATFAAE